MDFNEIVEVPWDFGEDDEYDQYVEKAYKKAEKKAEKSDTLKNQMFWLGVADGSVCYVITKVNKRTVNVEWRGFSNPDNYVDQVLGYVGKLDIERAEALVGWERKRKELFKSKSSVR